MYLFNYPLYYTDLFDFLHLELTISVWSYVPQRQID